MNARHPDEDKFIAKPRPASGFRAWPRFWDLRPADGAQEDFGKGGRRFTRSALSVEKTIAQSLKAESRERPSPSHLAFPFPTRFKASLQSPLPIRFGIASLEAFDRHPNRACQARL